VKIEGWELPLLRPMTVFRSDLFGGSVGGQKGYSRSKEIKSQKGDVDCATSQIKGEQEDIRVTPEKYDPSEQENSLKRKIYLASQSEFLGYENHLVTSDLAF
jgi:hypothetical protein